MKNRRMSTEIVEVAEEEKYKIQPFEGWRRMSLEDDQHFLDANSSPMGKGFYLVSTESSERPKPAHTHSNLLSELKVDEGHSSESLDIPASTDINPFRRDIEDEIVVGDDAFGETDQRHLSIND